MFNHYQYNAEITKKNNMFINLQTFLESIRENVFMNVPITFNIDINTNRSSNNLLCLRNFTTIFKIMESNKDLFQNLNSKPESINDIINLLQLRTQNAARMMKQRDPIFPTGFDKKVVPQYTKFIMPLCHFV